MFNYSTVAKMSTNTVSNINLYFKIIMKPVISVSIASLCPSPFPLQFLGSQANCIFEEMQSFQRIRSKISCKGQTYQAWIDSEGTFNELQLHDVGDAVAFFLSLSEAIRAWLLLTNHPQLIPLQTPLLSKQNQVA